jgi:hypothetical protein
MRPGLQLVGGEVQVCEQHLASAQQGNFRRLRFLHLDDQVRRREHLGHGVQDGCAGFAIRVVVIADSGAGRVLDHDLVAVLNQFPHAGRGHPNPVFVGLDFLWNADLHVLAPDDHSPDIGGKAREYNTPRCFGVCRRRNGSVRAGHCITQPVFVNGEFRQVTIFPNVDTYVYTTERVLAPHDSHCRNDERRFSLWQHAAPGRR